MNESDAAQIFCSAMFPYSSIVIRCRLMPPVIATMIQTIAQRPAVRIVRIRCRTWWTGLPVAIVAWKSLRFSIRQP